MGSDGSGREMNEDRARRLGRNHAGYAVGAGRETARGSQREGLGFRLVVGEREALAG